MQGFIGEVRIFAGNFAPRNWAFCRGQLVAINSNSAMFSILGTTYGGDGRTTFGLPDLRGRSPIGPGTGPGLPTYRLGQRLGSHTNTLIAANLPSHTHATTVQVNTAAETEADPTTFLSAAGIYAEEATSGAHLGGVVSGNNGGSQAMNNEQPYLTVEYIICQFGTFPSRH